MTAARAGCVRQRRIISAIPAPNRSDTAGIMLYAYSSLMCFMKVNGSTLAPAIAAAGQKSFAFGDRTIPHITAPESESERRMIPAVNIQFPSANQRYDVT